MKEDNIYIRGMIALFTKLRWSSEVLQSKHQSLLCSTEVDNVSSEEPSDSDFLMLNQTIKI